MFSEQEENTINFDDINKFLDDLEKGEKEFVDVNKKLRSAYSGSENQADRDAVINKIKKSEEKLKSINQVKKDIDDKKKELENKKNSFSQEKSSEQQKKSSEILNFQMESIRKFIRKTLKESAL